METRPTLGWSGAGVRQIAIDGAGVRGGNLWTVKVPRCLPANPYPLYYRGAWR